MIQNNKEFTDLLNKFYDNGLLKEVYRSKKVIVCNVFDQYYLAIPLDLLNTCEHMYAGYVINSNGLRSILEEDNYILRHINALSEEMYDKSFALINENLFQHMLKHKDEFSKRPPKDCMDLAFEQEVLLKGKAALKQNDTPKKGGLSKIFKRK